MPDLDPQLVQMIAAQVIAVLRERGIASGIAGSSTTSSGGTPTRVDIHPPIGTCTGDYSKFPELAGKFGGGSGGGSSIPIPSREGQGESSSAVGKITTAIAPLAGIITANQLQAALDAAPDGVVLLGPTARLSPLANDLARKFAARVKRVSSDAAGVTTGNAGGASASASAASLPWMWWIDGTCPVVRDVTAQRSDRLRLVSAGATPGALAHAVRELAVAIKSRSVAGGLLFVHNAARAACLANRCASIRAVVGTCGEAVEQGVTELGANTLIVEYPHHGYRSVTAMVDRMLAQPPRPPAAVERDLADLHRCG